MNQAIPGDRQPRRRRRAAGAGQPAAGPGAPQAPAGPRAARGLARNLGTQAGELLRDHGRVTAGGRVYRVVVPGGRSPRGPVYLLRDDGRVFAVRLSARVREVAPGEAGIDAGR